MVAININPGTVTRNLFLVAARSATGVDNLKPHIQEFEATRIKARWKHKGIMRRVCLSLNGNGHSGMWGADHKMWAGNFSPWEVKPTTSLYVQ